MNYKNVKNPFDLFVQTDEDNYDVIPEEESNDNSTSTLFNIVFIIVQIMVIILAVVGIISLTNPSVRQELTNVLSNFI